MARQVFETAPREADNRVTILARVLSWAAKDGPWKSNVLVGFERAYTSDRSDIIWLLEQVEAFLAAASLHVSMALALHTGQRQADIRKLAWSAYDGASISLRQGKANRLGKTAPVTRVPCTKALKATLTAPRAAPLLILHHQTGRAYQKRYFAQQWTRPAKPPVLQICTFTTYADDVTMLFRAVNIGEIVTITGHSLRRALTFWTNTQLRTSQLAESAIAKFENVLETDFAKRPAKRGS
jgi:integrase